MIMMILLRWYTISTYYMNSHLPISWPLQLGRHYTYNIHFIILTYFIFFFVLLTPFCQSILIMLHLLASHYTQLTTTVLLIKITWLCSMPHIVNLSNHSIFLWLNSDILNFNIKNSHHLMVQGKNLCNFTLWRYFVKCWILNIKIGL